MSNALAIALGLTAACGPQRVLRGAPEGTQAATAARELAVALPAIGEVRGRTLADGWPIWVIRHDTGAITVVSAVAPPHGRSAPMLFGGRAALVRWLPATRRLLAGDVLYDERGHVLGYATDDDCIDNCPRVAEPAPDERDLDRFETTLAASRVLVGARVASAPHPIVSHWVAWDHQEHVARELAPGVDEQVPVAPVALAAAVARPIGSYSVTVGSIVQSTGAPPRVCADTPSCATCDATSPLALGVDDVRVDQDTMHARSGTLLVRHDAGGLAVIATSRAGSCDRPR